MRPTKPLPFLDKSGWVLQGSDDVGTGSYAPDRVQEGGEKKSRYPGQ